MNTLINEPDEFPAGALRLLREAGSVHLATNPYPANAIDTIFVRLRDRIGKDFHRRFPALRRIVTPTTGLNHIDTAYFESAGITILSLRGRTDFLVNIHATAEHTLALALALIRKLPAACNSVALGEWNRYPFKGTELFGKRIVLLGYGRLGAQVAGLFRAFGSDVRAYDRERAKVPDSLYIPLEEGVSTADLLSLHISFEPANAGWFGRDLLSRMKEGAFFINTSRGEIVDQQALLEALAQRRIAGAALDVLEGEPSPLNQRLLELANDPSLNLLLTPHIAGFTAESLEAVELYMTQVLLSDPKTSDGAV